MATDSGLAVGLSTRLPRNDRASTAVLYVLLKPLIIALDGNHSNCCGKLVLLNFAFSRAFNSYSMVGEGASQL